MKSPKYHSYEQIPKPSYTAPAVESFTNPEQATLIWPEAILENPEFQEQTEKQRLLIESFRTITAELPIAINIENALENHRVTEEELARFYTQLCEYIESDEAHARLVLYFPFELLPVKKSEGVSALLNESAERFINTYKTAWENQLNFHEVRANFSDGDVLEQELLRGDHPRVVKATHLIPSLIERGILSFQEIIEYAENSSDPLVKEGVLDAFEIVFDRQLASTKELDELKNSKDTTLKNGYNLLRAHQAEIKEHTENVHESFSSIANDLEMQLHNIATYEPEHSTPARTAWLRKEAIQKALSNTAKRVEATLEAGANLPEPETLTPVSIRACIDALRQASLTDATIYRKHLHWLEKVENNEHDADTTDALSKLYAHLHATQVIEDTELDLHEVAIPKLAGPFSENLKPIEPFLKEISQMSKSIENDPYLGERVYPVTLVFGSQLKGYGTKNADADVAVFIRPGVDRNERTELEHGLSKIFAHEKIGGKAVLFWIDKTDEGLKVHNWSAEANSDGKSSWIHVLLGAAWEGDKNSILELHQELLTNYFYDPNTMLEGKPTRDRWLEEMERDTLQYRLLHKGFERYYPINSPMDTSHGDAIDGQSAFYDPRYRRIATELYLSRIFLPKLER